MSDKKEEPDVKSPYKKPYGDDGDATQELQVGFHDWSELLGSRSDQMCFAIIAANWVVHGSGADGLIANWFALMSVGLVVVYLGVTLVLIRNMATLYRDRIILAYGNVKKWEAEFHDQQHNEWPYSAEIQKLGNTIRWLRTWIPLIAGIFFLLGIGREVVPGFG